MTAKIVPYIAPSKEFRLKLRYTSALGSKTHSTGYLDSLGRAWGLAGPLLAHRSAVGGHMGHNLNSLKGVTEKNPSAMDVSMLKKVENGLSWM